MSRSSNAGAAGRQVCRAAETLSTLVSLHSYLAVIMATSAPTVMTSQPMVTLIGNRALLPCGTVASPPSSAPGVADVIISDDVRWLGPGESVTVSRDVASNSRMRILSNGDLLINYASFPRDNGTWSCLRLGVLHESTLLILVPPSTTVPTISPSDVAAVDFRSEAWTFTCVADFAFPPVELKWKKLHGPEASYIATLTSMVTSRSGTMSTSVKLVLSPLSMGSVFACEASHPTFGGHVTSAQLRYIIPGFNGLPPSAGSLPSANAMQAGQQQLEPVDRLIVAVFMGVIIVFVLIVALAFFGRKRWYIKALQRHPPTTIKTAEDGRQEPTTSEHLLNNGRAQNGPKTANNDRKAPEPSDDWQRRLTRCLRCSLGVALVAVLLLTLSLSIPVYFKGILTPHTGTDEVLAVTGGSALWLDCTQLVRPIESLVHVTWSRNRDVIYHQELLQIPGGRTFVGFPANATAGFLFAARATSRSVGHVTVFPLLPGEDGVYTCSVYMAQDDGGRTVVRRKTTAVFVLTGPITNTALVGLLAVAMVTTMLVLAFVLCLCVRFRCPAKPPSQTRTPPVVDSSVC